MPQDLFTSPSPADLPEKPVYAIGVVLATAIFVLTLKILLPSSVGAVEPGPMSTDAAAIDISGPASASKRF